MKNVVLLRSNPVNPDPPVEKIADALLAKGYNVTIVAWDRDNDYKLIEDCLALQRGTAKVIRFGIPAIFGGGLKSTLKPLAVFQYRMFCWLKKHHSEYDIIHSFDFDTGLLASMAAKKYNKKHIYHILDFYVDSHGLSGRLGRIIRSVETNVINSADCTIICTEKRKEQIKGSKPKKLIVVHNTPKQNICVDTEFEIGSKSDRCKIVYVGILAGSRFLKQMISFVKKDERFELHIGGFGKMENEIVSASQECDRVIYYGKLPYEKTLALESACDIMTAIYDPSVPNHRYAAPNKFYESLMLGKPVIMAENTGFDDIVMQNHIGKIFDFSEEDFERVMYQLLAEKDNWQAMGEKMKHLYKTEYSWYEMEERVINMYNSL